MPNPFVFAALSMIAVTAGCARPHMTQRPTRVVPVAATTVDHPIKAGDSPAAAPGTEVPGGPKDSDDSRAHGPRPRPNDQAPRE